MSALRAGARNKRNVSRDGLPGGAARQALQHRRRVGQRGHQLVDAGNHDVHRRQRAGQPRVALVAHQHHRAGFGHQCVRAGDPSTGVDEPTPQMPRRCPHQYVRIRRKVFAGRLANQFGRALARDVQAGAMMCDGRSPATCTRNSPRSVSTTSIPSSSSAGLS